MRPVCGKPGTMPNFDPSPAALYTIPQLFHGFDPARTETFGQTPDFEIYKQFVADGGAASTHKPMVLKRAEHDCTILQLLAQALAGRKVVAMMGGHAVNRSLTAYAEAAMTAAMLTERGYLIITGGGPGAMEAAHLGAMIGRPGADLDRALNLLRTAPVPQSHGRPVTYTGDPKAPIHENPAAIQALGDYYKPAWEIRQDHPAGGGIAIPTWMYGWEPTTMFAAAVGKYFQNSIREDGLLAAASHGIVYCEGRAGTLQEVFQDAAQNYYKSFPAPAEGERGWSSPMVFLGDFWTLDDQTDSSRPTLPVKRLLDKLWLAGGKAATAALVSYVLTPAEAVEKIAAFEPPHQTQAVRIAIETQSPSAV
ncbi:hypothetical protein ABI_28770 [Asticcacaulis biprosthecium C19]|uniref:Rossmann fold nucleotide-binding protein n=2 Tax=Asticcacaulis biprosthecium TaxID=76891 RepID=F4QML9_9CAUL|nr:hypothetical protein ABI_28770 [Asticcacaulis biprosthecium C19]